MTRILLEALQDGAHTHTHTDYRCGSPDDWSELLTMRTLGDENSAPTFAVFGDFGFENARSLPWLIDDADKGRFDLVLHAGDLAYNLFNVSIERIGCALHVCC